MDCGSRVVIFLATGSTQDTSTRKTTVMTYFPKFDNEYDELLSGWEAKQNVRGVVYYTNSNYQLTSWNHPFLTKIFQSLDEYRDVRYAAYRTALKLRRLQTCLGLSVITMEAIQHVFPHALTQEEREVSCVHAHTLLCLLLEASCRSHSLASEGKEILTIADLVLNLLLNLFDINRSGKLALRSMKFALTALCPARLSEKYKYFGLELRDPNGQISREKLSHFIDDLVQVTDIIQETPSFGCDINAAVETCFEKGLILPTDCVSEETFQSWLHREPQTLVWLPTLHRLSATETIEHDVRCASCKAQPIVGFRYRCLQCFSYDLCQKCFLLGRTSLPHKLKHPVQEYCLPTSTKQNTKAFLKIMRNKMSKKHRCRTKVSYLPVEQLATAHHRQRKTFPELKRVARTQSLDSGLDSDQVYSLSDGQITLTSCLNDDGTHNPGFGQPRNCSSPFFRKKDPGERHLSRCEIESQQNWMVLTIEQLRQENRNLRFKLAQLEGKNMKTLEKGRSQSSLEDVKEMPQPSSCLSPIPETPTGPAEPKAETTLNIVGIYTPVVSGETASQVSIQSEESSTANLNNQTSSVMSSNALCQQKHHQTTETSENGLAYTLSDMTFSSKTATSSGSQLVKGQTANLTKPDTPRTEQETESSEDGLAYTLSDMTLASKLANPEMLQQTSSDKKDEKSSSDDSLLESSSESSNNLTSLYITESNHLSDRSNIKNNQKVESQHLLENVIVNKFEDMEVLSPVCEDGCLVKSRNTSFATPDISTEFNQTTNNLESLDVEPEKSPCRRLSIAPVHMSTPLSSKKSSYRKNKSKIPSSNSENKENECKTSKYLKASKSTPKSCTTPLSAIPSWHKKRILASSNSCNSNYSRNNQTESSNSSAGCNVKTDAAKSMISISNPGGLSTMFTEAELLVESLGVETLPSADREELNRIMRDFELDAKSLNIQDDPGLPDKKDSSILEAVLHIGDAMADLVHVTTQTTRF